MTRPQDPSNPGSPRSEAAPGDVEDPPVGPGSSAGTEESPPEDEPSARKSLRRRLVDFWGRHRVIFWMGHSVWALATGVVVVFLARERYAFVPWIVVFLGLTWASTLFFGRNAKDQWERRAAERSEREAREGEKEGSEGATRAARPSDEESAAADHVDEESAPTADTDAPSVGHEVTSYVTRSLYQETLFFLLPFYAYSTVLRSPNVVFVGLLAGLAILSCLDLLFDRWLRTKVVFGLVFFATVSFAAVNLLLPMIAGLSPRVATPVAAVLAIGSAVPLAVRGGRRSRGAHLRLGAAAAAILVVAVWLPSAVPPVPLRMTSATFAADIDRESLELAGTLDSPVPMDRLGGRLVVLVEVFAPTSLPATVRLEWRHEGETVRTTRDVEIVAHEGSFRVWDALAPPVVTLEPGEYEVILRTAAGRWFGRAAIVLVPG